MGVTETPVIGRATERAQLEATMGRALRGEPQLAVLFGRRRVGKTFLLRHVLDDGEVPALYFAALRGRSRDELDRFSAESARVLSTPICTDWRSQFAALVDAARTRPVVVAIDEAPYLVDEDPSWTSALQHAWDDAQRGGACHLFICLTGSAVTTMSTIISSGGPLFGRATTRIRLDPFDLPMAHVLLGAPSDPRTTIEAYAACGGYPLLLRQWDLRLRAENNLVRLAGAPLAPLATDANALLLDLPDPTGYRRVLSAIGRRRKRSEINTDVGHRTDRALAVLEQAGLVRRSYPVDERTPKAFEYQLADPYLAFWFRIVDPNQQEIDSGQGAEALRRSLPAWQQHLAAVFEDEARAHAARLVRGSLFPSGVVGRWWTNRPRQAELDVVVNADRWTVVGEAKWTDRFGSTEWRAFNQHLDVAGDRATHAVRALWVKGSVDASVRALAPKLLVFGPSDMVAVNADSDPPA